MALKSASRALNCWTLLATLLFSQSLRAIQITGASGGVNSSTGERPFRYEIDQFSQSGPPFDLYIQALRQLQSIDQSNALSYFQISGIHGFPIVPWDGVVGTGSYPGYCTHAATPFPTWHRPYIALHEQAIWNIAQIIARSYPVEARDQYQAAALSLRIPFWDWAANPALPETVIQPMISINTPDGFQYIQNPLFNYTFQHNAGGNGFPSGPPMSSFPWTVRWWNETAGAENQSAATAALMSNAPSILSMTYQLFSTVTNYTTFSCTWPGGQTNTGNNIENIHNSIHNSVGGWGHMQFPEVAAFDPIFWLHHANVDRLFAMWQALNPDSYIEPTPNMYGTYYETPGTVDSGNTSLAPFHSDNATTMFTSEDVRGTRLFGYSYPELPDWEMSQSDLTIRVRQEINQLYNPFLSPNGRQERYSTSRRTANLASMFSHITLNLAKELGVNNLEVQWSIRIDIDRFAYDQSFAIDFFMGDPPSDVSIWATAPNLVGSHGQFIAANVTEMHPDGRPAGGLQGEVSLAHTLAAGVSRGLLADLSPDSVIPLLQDGLNWRARAADGCEIDVSALTGLSISVASREVQPTTSIDQFPVYGDVRFHPVVTQGKPGGAEQWYRLAY